jgi:hypothetical protein
MLKTKRKNMQKTKVSLVCKCKGVFNGRETLQGIFLIWKNGVLKDDSNHEYFVYNSCRYSPISLTPNTTYNIDGYLFLNNDCKMSIEIITADKVVNLAT